MTKTQRAERHNEKNRMMVDIENLKGQLDEAQNEITHLQLDLELAKENATWTFCVYCEERFQYNGVPDGIEKAKAHVAVCPEHPIRKLEAEAVELRRDRARLKWWTKHSGYWIFDNEGHFMMYSGTSRITDWHDTPEAAIDEAMGGSVMTEEICSKTGIKWEDCECGFCERGPSTKVKRQSEERAYKPLDPRDALIAQMAATIYAGGLHALSGELDRMLDAEDCVKLAREILAEAERIK